MPGSLHHRCRHGNQENDTSGRNYDGGDDGVIEVWMDYDDGCKNGKTLLNIVHFASSHVNNANERSNSQSTIETCSKTIYI